MWVVLFSADLFAAIGESETFFIPSDKINFRMWDDIFCD